MFVSGVGESETGFCDSVAQDLGLGVAARRSLGGAHMLLLHVCDQLMVPFVGKFSPRDYE